MIEPYDLIYYDEQFIKPPKRGKLYSKDEFNSYYSQIACIDEQLHGNYIEIERLAKRIDSQVNKKVVEKNGIESNVKELFFSYRGRITSFAWFNARGLVTKDTWTYDNVIKLYRKTIDEVVVEINKAVAVANDPILFDTDDPEEFIDKFNELSPAVIMHYERWVLYFEEKYFRNNLLVSHEEKYFRNNLLDSYKIRKNYGIEVAIRVGDIGKVVSSNDLMRALLKKHITMAQFRDIIQTNYDYILDREINLYQSDKKALKKYIEILHDKFEVRAWKMTYANISKALDAKIENNDLKVVLLPGVSVGFVLKGETIQSILDRYRLILSLDEQQIKEQLFSDKRSSSNYGYMKPRKMIEAKTLSQLYNYTTAVRQSEAQAQRIRILKLKYKYQR